MNDLVLYNGRIVDGSGQPSRDGSVAVVGDRIVDIRYDVMPLSARCVLDCTGKVIAPGFIDIHSHSDFSILINPRSESKVRQGITTELCGNCGGSASPLVGPYREYITRLYKVVYDLKINWQDLSGYFEKLQRLGTSVNVAVLTGFSNVYGAVCGFEAKCVNAEAIAAMQELIRQSMRQGAFGLSVGFLYPPDCWTDPVIVAHLLTVVAEEGGFLAIHVRNEEDRVVESIQEAIDMARAANIPLQISHLKAAGEDNWDKIDAVIEWITSARSQGMHVHCDRYPYLATSASLDVMLPKWAYEGGDLVEIERLKSSDMRLKFKEHILSTYDIERYQHQVRIASVIRPEHEYLEGKTLSEAATLQNKDLFDFIFDLLIEEKVKVKSAYFCMSPANLRRIYALPYISVCTDSSSKADYGKLYECLPHPRTYGSFPRFIRQFCREEQLLTLEEGVRRMTSLPAKCIGLSQRGRIKRGTFADLVVFDYDRVTDTATFSTPHQYPLGIKYVIVNGVLTVESGQHTGALAGRTLRACSENGRRGII